MKKKQLFSLRKLSVGIASVSLGTVVFLSGAQAVNAQDNAPDATTITQNAYNVVNNLPNISDKTKDAYIAKITAAAGNNKLTDVEGIVNSAKAEDAQVATAKKVAAEQDAKAVNQQVELAKKVAIETAKKDHAQKIANAKAEIYKLENLSNFTKARYSAKITKAATDEIAGLVQNAKAEDAKIATAKNAGKEQAKADAAAKDKAVKALNQKTADAYQVINSLKNITDKQQLSFLHQVEVDSGTNNGERIDAIVADAKQLDAQFAYDKEQKAKADAAAKDKAVKALNQKTADAYQVINSLKNITDKQQLSFLHQVEVDSGTNNGERIDAIVADAKQLDAQFAYDKEQKAKAEQKAARELNTLTQVAYNTVNGLHNLTDQQKDAFNKQILHDSGNNNGHNLNNIVANAKSLDEQNGNAKHAREAGASTVEQKDKAVRELNTLTSVAYNTVNGLHNLTDAQKEDFNYQILVDSGNNNGQKINDIVAAAKQKDAENAQAKHVREAGANTNLPADVAKKVKAAHNTVEALKNLKPEQKAAAHRKLNEVARTDAKAIDTVVAQAKELNANQAPANNEGAKKEIELAQKAHADQIKQAQALVNKLENVSKEAQDEYNSRIAKAATDEVEAIVKEAQAEDAHAVTAKKEITAAKNAHTEQIKKAQTLVDNLGNLSKKAKDEYKNKIAKAATDEVEAIVKEAQAENAKQAPAKKDVKPAQKAATTPVQAKDNKAGQNNKVVTGQKAGQTTATTNKAAAQQKAKDAKKQLPATGEQDQVLFGLLSGSLFASAGTLFLLNARRRKENE